MNTKLKRLQRSMPRRCKISSAISAALLGVGLGLGGMVTGQGQQGTQPAVQVRCAECGTLNPESAKFCASCGEALTAQSEAPATGVAGPSCGTQNAPGAKFCSNCGTSLAPATVACPQCGTQSPAGTKFCPNCGTNLQAPPQGKPPDPPGSPPQTPSA